MSSFADLRAQRQSKTPKSYASIPAATATSESQSTVQPSSADVEAVGASITDTQNKTRDGLIPTVSSSGVSRVVDKGELYACLPPTLELRTNSGSGRGVYVTKGLAPGEIAFVARPHVHVLSTRNLASYCSACALPGESLRRCTTCKVAHYCDADCQNRDWSLHKKECQALLRWASAAPNAEVAVPAEPIRALGRWLWAKQKHSPTTTWAREMDGMQSHRSSLPAEAAEGHTHLAHAVVRYLGLNTPPQLAEYGIKNAADVVDLISRFTTNALTLTSPALTPLGVVISPAVALLNHSCSPNAVVVFPRTAERKAEPLMHVVAIRPIAPGEEILTAYIDTTLPRTQRQATLRATYNFDCTCSTCILPPSSDPRASRPCPRAPACSGSCALPFSPDTSSQKPPTEDEAEVDIRCDKCDTSLPDAPALADLLRVAQEGLDKAYSLQLSNPSHALKLCNNLLPLLVSSACPPASHPRLSLTRLRQGLMIDRLAESPDDADEAQSRLDECVRAAAASVDGLCGVLTPGHPVRALAWAEYGKLLAVDEPAPKGFVDGVPSAPKALTEPPTSDAAEEKELVAFPPSGAARLRLAREALVRARDELLCAFGVRNEGGEVGKEVRESLVAVERELDVWIRRGTLAREDVAGKR
ncbi:SET domain-containing protein [Peniophora sp. CONT]|nr:SET domain-containing protein [Peniophora sp. CONT]